MKKKVQVVVTGDNLNWGKEPESFTDLISLVESFDPDKHELVKIGSHDIPIDNKVMTKEDILNSIDPVFQSEIPSDVWDKAAVLNAMQQYADQQSVGFMEWTLTVEAARWAINLDETPTREQMLEKFKQSLKP